MATVAVFVALGGSSYAAIKVTGKNVPKDALTGADIKNLTGKDVRNNSITGADVKNLTTGDVANGRLLAEDFAPGQLPRGEMGATGPPGSFPDALPSGKTLRGMYRMEGDGDGVTGACCAADALSFGFAVAAEPTGHFLESGDSDPACPGSAGSPQANPGHLCVYEAAKTMNATNAGLVSTTRYGADLFVDSNAVGDYLSTGSWAVTAP